MNILVGLDYGKVRCGIAISDPNHMIASPHKTVNNNLLIDSLVEINNEYGISKLIVGLPKKMNNQIFDLEHEIQSVIKRVKKEFHPSSLKEWMRDSHQKFQNTFLMLLHINKKIEEIKKI